MPSVIRYPSGSESDAVKNAFYCGDDDGKIGIRCDVTAGNLPETVIVTHGKIAVEALLAEKMLKEQGIDVAIILCEYIAPYDALAREIADFWKTNSPKNVVFLEEEIKSGGFGMLLSQKMSDLDMLGGKKHLILAAEDAFVTRRTGESYLEASGLDHKSIAEKIKNFN